MAQGDLFWQNIKWSWEECWVHHQILDAWVPPALSLPGWAEMLGSSPQRPGTPGSSVSCGFSLGMGYQTHGMQPPVLPEPWCSHWAGPALPFLCTGQTRRNSRWRDFSLPTLVSLPLPKFKKGYFKWCHNIAMMNRSENEVSLITLLWS